jgi:Family of unknown function (DUF5681)
MDREGADFLLQKTATTAARVRGRRFRKGQSGNPKGRPRGSLNRGTRAAALLLDGEAELLARKAVELALAGDAGALRLCLDRIVAPRREQPCSLALPEIRNPGDIGDAMAALIAAAARGEIPTGEALSFSQTIDTYLRAIDASDFDRRLRKLEEMDAANNPHRKY